jgi:hypothetical protein
MSSTLKLTAWMCVFVAPATILGLFVSRPKRTAKQCPLHYTESG